MNKTGTQRIETHRLVLRQYRIEDAEDVFNNWASDPEVTRYLTWPTHSDVSITQKVINSWIPYYEDGGYFNWVLEWKESGKAIGSITVVKLNEETEAADIGYCLSREFWGRGIMPEALRAVMDYLFDIVGVNRIAAYHDARNPKSGRVMEKAGMKLDGILRANGKNNQGICDEVWYSALRDDRKPKEQKQKTSVIVRFARNDELGQVNVLRKQVNELHVDGASHIFKPGFPKELRDYIYTIWDDPKQKIVVAEQNGNICGFAVLNHIVRPENHFMFTRDFLDIDEFGVDEKHQRQGIANAMIAFICDYAKAEGLHRIELNMWEFNRGALAFYETEGFSTYRRYMEMRFDYVENWLD